MVSVLSMVVTVASTPLLMVIVGLLSATALLKVAMTRRVSASLTEIVDVVVVPPSVE